MTLMGSAVPRERGILSIILLYCLSVLQINISGRLQKTRIKCLGKQNIMETLKEFLPNFVFIYLLKGRSFYRCPHSFAKWLKTSL